MKLFKHNILKRDFLDTKKSCDYENLVTCTVLTVHILVMPRGRPRTVRHLYAYQTTERYAPFVSWKEDAYDALPEKRRWTCTSSPVLVKLPPREQQLKWHVMRVSTQLYTGTNIAGTCLYNHTSCGTPALRFKCHQERCIDLTSVLPSSDPELSGNNEEFSVNAIDITICLELTFLSTHTHNDANILHNILHNLYDCLNSFINNALSL